MVEVNCETDFVARSEKFLELCEDLSMQVLVLPAPIGPVLPLACIASHWRSTLIRHPCLGLAYHAAADDESCQCYLAILPLYHTCLDAGTGKRKIFLKCSIAPCWPLSPMLLLAVELLMQHSSDVPMTAHQKLQKTRGNASASTLLMPSWQLHHRPF